jgi:hypothetical protein
MRLLAPLFLMTLIFAACSDDSGTKNSPPPAEMVGTWQEATPQSSSPGPQDVCDGLSVGSGAVSSFIFKVDEFGNVYDSNNMTDANTPYRIIGTMDSAGNIVPNAAGREEFLGQFSSVSGVTLNPIITAKYEFSTLKGQLMKLNIDLQIISNGQTTTQPFTKREYAKMSDVTEKLWLTKAKQCLAKTKP